MRERLAVTSNTCPLLEAKAEFMNFKRTIGHALGRRDRLSTAPHTPLPSLAGWVAFSNLIQFFTASRP